MVMGFLARALVYFLSPTLYLGGEPGNLGRNERRTLTLLYYVKFCYFAMAYVLGGQDFKNGFFDPISCSESADRSAVLYKH